MREKVLVTGGRGSIGAILVNELQELGCHVSVLDSLDGGDIRNLEHVRQMVDGKDSVFHLAAVADLNWARQHPLETMDINVRGTRNMAYACHLQRAKLYYVSTCCVYGEQEHHPATEDSLPNPSEIYACSKLAGERAILGFHRTYGLSYNILRIATVYGPRTRPALATNIFFRQALKGEPLTVHGDGMQTRTLTYIDDLLDAIVALYESGKINDTWNLTATEEISALKMALDIRELTQSRSIIIHTPQRVGQLFKESISADKMLSEVGWRARVGWEEGLKRTYNWLANQNDIYERTNLPTKE